MLPPSEAPGQLERVLDLLARLSSHPSSEFQQLIAAIIRTIRPGTTVVVVTGREPRPYLAHLRRLELPGRRARLRGERRRRRGPGPGGRIDRSRRPARRAVADRRPSRRRVGPAGGGPADRATAMTPSSSPQAPEAPTERKIPAPPTNGGPSSPTARGAIARVVELMPLVLVCIAEAAWISVVGGLVQEFTLHQPEIGIAQLAVLVAIGATIAHVAEPRLGRRWPAVALALVILAGLAGLLASGAARASLSAGLGPTIAAHPGGLRRARDARGFAHCGRRSPNAR
jgi:hypothetical protein